MQGITRKGSPKGQAYRVAKPPYGKESLSQRDHFVMGEVNTCQDSTTNVTI